MAAPVGNGDIFRNIYDRNLWEDGGSGIGSAVKYSAKFIDYVRGVVHGKKVLDLGCGDFRIGRELYQGTGEYTAVDVMADRFKYPRNVRSVEADFSQPGVIAKLFEEPYDVVILKDVLMHWTDEEIRRFVREFLPLNWRTVLIANKYKYVRKPAYNGRPRNPRVNKYSMAPLPHNHPTLKALKLGVVLHYPSVSCVELSRRDK